MSTKTRPPAGSLSPGPLSAAPPDRAPPILIGTAELVDLPAWGIWGLRAKVDTGARTSALHVTGITEVGNGRIRFDVVLDAEHTPRRVRIEAAISRTANVRSSNGKATTRYFVVTQLCLGALSKPVEVSLAERTDLRYRMLLGRTALAREVLVDPGRRYVASGRKSKAPPCPTAPPPRTRTRARQRLDP